MSIEPLLFELSQARDQLTEVKAIIQEAEMNLHAEMELAYDLRVKTEAQVKQLESDIRAMTLQAWVQTGSPPHPAVNVRRLLKYRYVVEDVVEWIIEELPRNPDLILLLTVDKTKLENEIKGGRLQCDRVFPQYEPQPTIATRLAKVLSGGSDDGE